MRPGKAVRVVFLHAGSQLKLSDNYIDAFKLLLKKLVSLGMKKEPSKDPGQVRDPIVLGDHEVDQVVVVLPGVLPHLAPLEADLGAQVPAISRHCGIIRHLLGPVKPPEVF